MADNVSMNYPSTQPRQDGQQGQTEIFVGEIAPDDDQEFEIISWDNFYDEQIV